MTLFEYLAIAFSLVFSFTAIRLVGGLPFAFDGTRRYWIHLVVIGLQLGCVAGGFWGFWSYRDVVWSFPKFLLALSGPGVFYFLATTLVPESPSQVASWRDYYYSVRVPYFVGFSC